ncbi:hypothetical protein K474DRAFT_366686 [Panus rudis PR-1116 ss-1]|nr:hypothetical protein K474DRAFT_366686 [Panus rudis PR-1116 ss-1]
MLRRMGTPIGISRPGPFTAPSNSQWQESIFGPLVNITLIGSRTTALLSTCSCLQKDLMIFWFLVEMSCCTSALV